MKKLISIILLILMLVMCLAGCECDHEWNDATCQTPKTCKHCDATEGEVSEHAWVDADCNNPKTCKVCKLTEGEALAHDWADATCDAPKTCNRCNTTDGEAMGHDMAEANYQQPATCKNCDYTEGEALASEFASCGLNLIYAEMGKEYDYITTCHANKNAKTTGKLVLSGYSVFESGEGYEALDGYEWHTVTATVTFYDENAWNYGIAVQSFWDDYYVMDIWGDNNDTYIVNYNGVDYDQCIVNSGKWEFEEWDKEAKTCKATITMAWRVPIGYDGHLVGFRDSSTKYTAGQRINEFLEETALIFRFAYPTA